MREVGDVRLAVNRLAERERQLRGRAAVGFRLEQLAQRNLLARAVGNLDADGGLAGDAVDQHRLGLHREAQVVGEAGDLRVLHAGVGLELERRHDRARDESATTRALDRELAAFLLEQPRAVHQLALVDLALGLRRVEQRERRQRVLALAALGRRLGRRFRIGQRQRRAGMVTFGGFGGANDLGCRTAAPSAGARRALRRPRPCGALGARQLRRLARLDGGGVARLAGAARGEPLLRVLGDDFAALFLAPPLLAPLRKVVDAAHGAGCDRRDERGEEPAERELRRHDDRQEDQRQDDDHRAGAVEVFGHLLASHSPA